MLRFLSYFTDIKHVAAFPPAGLDFRVESALQEVTNNEESR